MYEQYFFILSDQKSDVQKQNRHDADGTVRDDFINAAYICFCAGADGVELLPTLVTIL